MLFRADNTGGRNKNEKQKRPPNGGASSLVSCCPRCGVLYGALQPRVIYVCSMLPSERLPAVACGHKVLRALAIARATVGSLVREKIVNSVGQRVRVYLYLRSTNVPALFVPSPHLRPTVRGCVSARAVAAFDKDRPTECIEVGQHCERSTRLDAPNAGRFIFRVFTFGLTGCLVRPVNPVRSAAYSRDYYCGFQCVAVTRPRHNRTTSALQTFVGSVQIILMCFVFVFECEAFTVR